MKKLIHKICMVGMLSIVIAACDNNFDEINTDPKTVYEINPNGHFYKILQIINDSSFEFFYDICFEMNWVQYWAGQSGNGATTYEYTGNMGDRYSRFVSAGGYAKDIQEYIASHMSAEEQEKYRDLVQISTIVLIYYGIYASDTFGSLVYDEGWQARYGGISDPAFQVQQDLYNEWDQQLKDAVTTLKSTNATQFSIGGYDVVYAGNVEKWIKAANALRLRLATRWTKRDMGKAKTIAGEVLGASATDLFASNADGWVFRFENIFTEHGNWAKVQDYRASYSMVKFMTDNNDPRLRMYFRKNDYSQEYIDLWNAQNPSKAIVYNPQQYVGGHSSPSQTRSREYLATSRKIIRTDGSEYTLDTLSRMQDRLFQATYDKGTGISWMPGITYADFCFMAAEFVALGVTSSKTAQQWYEAGVEASLRFFSDMGKASDLVDYTAVTDAEVTAYLANPAVAWDQAKALDRIYSQAYLNFFKNVNEAWALWKRTGYPNTTSTVVVEDLVTTAADPIVLPRRHSFTYPLEGTTNYANYKKRIDDMAADPDFGDVTDATGRIWWDKKVE